MVFPHNNTLASMPYNYKCITLIDSLITGMGSLIAMFCQGVKTLQLQKTTTTTKITVYFTSILLTTIAS